MELYLHMVGDYITQNNWMANTKIKNTKEGYLAAFIHCLLYALPFLFIGSLNAVLVIFITHFLIDKYRLARYVVQLKIGILVKKGFQKVHQIILVYGFCLLLII